MIDRYPDRLELRGMRFSARHGADPDEKERDQPFEVDLVLLADLRNAAERDDLAATIDYAGLFDLVATIMTGPSVDLIETLAATIAGRVLDTTDPALVGGVEVRVRKPAAPLPGPFDTVEATIVRRRA
jgi:7,8-dihydroneopterin aldolase/epimerase/oxygenase